MDKVWSFLGDFHPILVHFPLALFTIIFGLDLSKWIFKQNFNNLSKHAALLGLIFIIPTFITGLLASHNYAPTNHVLLLHRTFAYITVAVSIIHVFFRYYAGIKLEPYLLIFSFVNFVFIVLTGEEGGLLSHGKTPFQHPEMFLDFLFNFKPFP